MTLHRDLDLSDLLPSAQNWWESIATLDNEAAATEAIEHAARLMAPWPLYLVSIGRKDLSHKLVHQLVGATRMLAQALDCGGTGRL